MKQSKVSKETLVDLYINQRIGVQKICKQLNLSTITFYNLLIVYNIERRAGRSKVTYAKNRLDLIGQKFGRLTAIKPTDTSIRKAIVWQFECECGNVIEAIATRVKSGHKRSCGCLHNDIAKSYRLDNNPNWTGYETIRGSLWSTIKRSASVRNLEFNITIEYIWQLYQEQNGCCKLTNLPIVLDFRDSDKKERTASLDRIESNKGYVVGNVQWIHKTVNKMKMDIDEKTFIEFCKLVGQHNK